jgi:hypothetical protein
MAEPRITPTRLDAIRRVAFDPVCDGEDWVSEVRDLVVDLDAARRALVRRDQAVAELRRRADAHGSPIARAAYREAADLLERVGS